MAKKQSDRQIIEEMQRRRKESDSLCSRIHADYKKHKRFALAENGQWTEEESNRIGEPCMQVNRLLAYVMQVCNTMLKQDIGCDVEPVSDGADKVLARVRQAQVMACWDKGHGEAASAYILKDQLVGGIGVIYPVIEYANSYGFEKKIKFKAIKDVTTFWWDNAAHGVAFEDMDYAGVDTYLTKGGFEKRYGDYKDFSSEGAKEKWEKGEKKKVTEYWRRVKTNPRTVYLTIDDQTMSESDVKAIQAGGDEPPIFLDDKGQPVTRTVYDCKVEQFIMGNDRILKREEWPLDRLPFKVAKGREYWEDSKLTLQPMTLAAENPQKKFNFIESQKAIMYSKGPLEIVFIPAGGDSSGLDDKLQEASRNGSKNIIVIPYQTHDDAGNLLPKPEFKPPLLVDGGLTQEGQIAIKDIEACFGMINAGWIDRPKSSSGIAIERTEAQGETSNFDYPMAWLSCLQEVYKDAMELCAKMSISMQVKLAGDDQRDETVWVNNERAAQQQGITNYNIEDDNEEYSLVIRARPAPDTLRQKSFDQMKEFGARHPQLAPMIADLDARTSLDSLYADDIAERAHKMIASQFPGVLAGSDDPRVMALQQQNQAMQQALQQMQQQAQEQVSKLELQLAGLKADKSNDAEKIRIEAQLEEQRIALEEFGKVTDRMKAMKVDRVESPNSKLVGE